MQPADLSAVDGNAAVEAAARRRCLEARRRVISLSYKANSAHVGSSLSVIEILDAILAVSNIRPATAAAVARDRIVFSKGHAAMAYYAMLEQHGLIDPGLLDNYLGDGSTLWGHVSLRAEVPAIDASTGSLGHGLSLAAGFALGHALRRDTALKTYCVLSDGECNEGATWEAAMFAGARRLERLTAVVDYNHIQSLARTADVMDLEPFAGKWRAFGWDAVEVDGHDSRALAAALRAPANGRPRVILAHTIKGRGIPRIENTVASHYHPARLADVMEAGCATA